MLFSVTPSFNYWVPGMLIDTPQITWHGGEAGKNAPILSLDIHPLSVARARGLNAFGTEGSSFVLATAGTDAEVRLWIVGQPLDKEEEQWEEPEVLGRSQSFVTSLGGHEQGVNVVRFSPDGLGLASASDGGTVVIWSVGEIGAWSTLATDRDTQKTILRGATEDIYDLTWSPDSKYIACGSIDRRAHVWEVATKRSIATLEDHANYVQVRPLCRRNWTRMGTACRTLSSSHRVPCTSTVDRTSISERHHDTHVCCLVGNAWNTVVWSVPKRF